jgi:uncharacterized membrane protein
MTDRLWQRHPGVAAGDDRTRGERAADSMRGVMGSWGFVLSFLAFMVAWAILNALVLKAGFDPYPFILLNLFLSMLAGLQGAILLIAAKRADSISAQVALHTEANTDAIVTLLNQHEQILTALHSKLLP